MSRKLEEMRSDLNSHISNAIDSAIEERVIPSIRNVLESQNTHLDLRSDGPHPNTFDRVRPHRDQRSDGPNQQIAGRTSLDVKKDFPRSVETNSNHINRQRENSVDSYHSDEDDGYDTVVTIITLTRLY